MFNLIQKEARHKLIQNGCFGSITVRVFMPIL